MKDTAKEIIEETKESFRNPYYLVLLIILGVATFLRFRYAFFEGMWVDEGRHAYIGVEIAQHLSEYATEHHGQVTEFLPLYMYMIAFSTYLFSTEFAVRVVSPVMGVAGVALTYFLGREMKNKEVGLIAAALVAVNPIYWFLSTRILTGATFATLYTATVLALYYGLEDREFSKYALWALGPLVALTLMTRQAAYTLGLVIPLYLLYVKRDELRELILEEVSVKETRLYQNTLTDTNYYIAAALGLVTIAPWAVRNMFTCGAPLCGVERALGFAGATSIPAWASTGGAFYYVFNLPSIVTLGVSLLVVFRVIQYFTEWTDRDADTLVKYVSLTIGAVLAAYLVLPGLVPLVLLTSIALYATNNAEKLLWLVIGIGIGFHSIPEIKVPRYAVFVIPQLLIVASLAMYSISDWISRQLESTVLTPWRIAAVLVLPLVFISYSQGMHNIAQGGFDNLEPAGNWLVENTDEDAEIIATSPTQTRYYAYPRFTHRMPNSEEELRSLIKDNNVSYVQVDAYERAQADWTQTGLPPYRLKVSTRQELQAGSISPQEVVEGYGEPPEYLEPVESFGQTQIPLTEQPQPMVIIYRVNQSVP